MSDRAKRTIYAAGIIERRDNHLLIARPRLPANAASSDRRKTESTPNADNHDAPREPWQFPRGPAREGESPETAMRRVARSRLGIEVEIVIGQPPLRQRVDDRDVEVRYFFCGIRAGAPKPGRFAEIRWINKAHLSEYDFDAVSKPIADWLAEQLR